MKFILLVGALCFAAGVQAGLFEEALTELTDAEREFAEKLHNIFELISAGKTGNNEVQAGVRSRGLISKFNQHCDCSEKNNCGCCGKVDAMGTKMDACVNASVIPDEYALQIKGKMGFFNLIDEKVSIKKLERACKRMPLFLNKIKVCIHSRMEKLEKEADFKSCMALEVEAYGTTVAYVNFRCLNYIDGVLSTTGEMMEMDPSKDPSIAVDSPNPIKAIVDLVKKVKDNADKDTDNKE